IDPLPYKFVGFLRQPVFQIKREGFGKSGDSEAEGVRAADGLDFRILPCPGMILFRTQESNSFRRYLERPITAIQRVPMVGGNFKFRLGRSALAVKQRTANSFR